MIDCFAFLAEPRRPWLDVEALKERFLKLTASTHPDRVYLKSPAELAEASRVFSELNSAYNRLREPKDRLAHLLELELSRRPSEIQAVREDAMELLFQIGQVCRETDQFLEGRTQVTSPLLKVQSFERALAFADRVMELQRMLQEQQETLELELRTYNEAWTIAPPIGSPNRAAQLPLARVEQIYRAISYISRWRAQLQDRFIQLSI